MAAVTTPTEIRAGSATVVSSLVTYGATITFGNPLYLDTADNKYKLADCNNTSTQAALAAIAITPGVDTGSGLIATSGDITYTGTTFVVGHTYFVGQTAGSIVPHADLTTNDWVQRIGTAISANTLRLSIEALLIQHA